MTRADTPPGRPTTRSRPKQGAHLLALRQAAGLTQAELAAFLGVPQTNVTFWEWSDKPPRGDVLPKMAKALRVSVDELLIESASPELQRRPGPVGQLQRAFEELQRLPREQQSKILEVVDALIEQYHRKQS